MRFLLVFLALALPLAAQTVNQWELRKRTSTGFTSYGITAENGKAIGFTAGVPAMLPITASSAWADITGKPSTFPPDAHTQAIGTITGLGTGVAAALVENVGGAGAFVVNSGALGAPSSGTLSHCTGLPISTGVSGLGTGVATALAQDVGSAGAFVTQSGLIGDLASLTPAAGYLYYDGAELYFTGVDISNVGSLGTGVATALGVNTGSDGAFVVKGGALGAPSAGTLTNCTGLPISTGVSGFGTGVATALAVNTGSAGAFVVNGGALGTPSSGTLTNCTGLPVSGITASTSTALGVGSVELGHATDTTLARSSAGVVTVEGATIATLSAANTFTQTQTMPGITGSYGGVGLLMNGNSTSGCFVGTGGYYAGLTVGSASGIGIGSGAPSSGYDTFFTRESAGVFQLGADSSAPTSYTLKVGDGSGTNIAGASLTLSTGRSTGSANGPDLVLASSMTGSSGSSANNTQERARVIGRYKDLTESTATNLASIALASGKVVGGTAAVTVWASDGTDHQSITSQVRFDAVNKAGTITATLTQTDNTTAASTGTLTVTYDVTQSGSAILLRANATSSLTQTTLRSRMVITALNGDDTQAVTPQ